MKISKITIRGFRSIFLAEISCNDFNVFVGQNNAGKTNMFEAVDWFFNGTPKGKSLSDFQFRRDHTVPVMVEIEFTGAQHGAQTMINEANRTKMLQVLGDSDAIIVRRSSESDGKRTIVVNGQEVDKLPTGFDRAFNDFLPKFEYITTRQYYDEFAKYSSKSPVGIMLASVLEEILKDNPQYRAFRDKFDELFSDDGSAVKIEFDRLGDSVKYYLERQFSECTKVGFEVSSPAFEDLLKNFQTRVDDGVETYAFEKGDGMQRALMLAIIQAYAAYRRSKDDQGKSFLFFIDEAELHLHPTAQRRLKDVLLELCQGSDQIFVNTHSSVFIADDPDGQVIHKVEKEDHKTSFQAVGPFDKPYVVFDMLGGSPADLLLPRNFLIVEGPSELHLLTRIIGRFYTDKPQIQIISAEGDTHQAERSLNAVKKAFSPLDVSLFSDRVIILLDAPSDRAKGSFDEFMRANRDGVARGQIHVLPNGSLEECYPQREDWKRTAAQVSDMDGHKKRQLAKRVGGQISKDEFEQGMPEIFAALSACWEKAF